MSLYFWITNERFNKISPLLPNKPRSAPRVDDRRALSGKRTILAPMDDFETQN